jgi:hypothetical protein
LVQGVDARDGLVLFAHAREPHGAGAGDELPRRRLGFPRLWLPAALAKSRPYPRLLLGVFSASRPCVAPRAPL